MTLTRQHTAPDRETLVATENGERIAYLSWHWYTHEIKGIKVREDRRRQGIATWLLREARREVPDIHHSAIRTEDGDAWAKSLHEPLPERFQDWS